MRGATPREEAVLGAEDGGGREYRAEEGEEEMGELEPDGSARRGGSVCGTIGVGIDQGLT